MKTQVIQLFIHDDIISIRDRMGWAKTPRILLVWPRRGKVGVRPLDLTLLRRHAESLGSELGIVTRDREIWTAARTQGISVFSNAPDAKKKRWRDWHSARPARRFPRKNMRAVRRNLPQAQSIMFSTNPVWSVFVFAIGVLSVLAVMLVFIPSAEVNINLPNQNQVLSIPVSSDPEIQTVQISGIVPQRFLTISQDGTDTALSSGIATLPAKTASGEVLLMNLTEEAIRVPPGTIFTTHRTPPVSFVTTRKTDVPTGKGSTATAQIVAVLPGVTGNVDSGSVTIFDGALGLRMVVTNPQPIAGGTETREMLPTDADRASLRKRLLSDMQRQALVLFLAKISEGDELFPATLTQVQVLEENFNPPDGKPGPKLSLKLRVEYRVAYADYTDLHILAERVLNASLPVGYEAASEQIDIKTVKEFFQSKEVVHWQMRIERKMRPVLDAGQVINIVQGRTAGYATDQLTSAFGLTQKPQISIRPAWWPWLPFLPIRITVKG